PHRPQHRRHGDAEDDQRCHGFDDRERSRSSAWRPAHVCLLHSRAHGVVMSPVPTCTVTVWPPANVSTPLAANEFWALFSGLPSQSNPQSAAPSNAAELMVTPANSFDPKVWEYALCRAASVIAVALALPGLPAGSCVRL